MSLNSLLSLEGKQDVKQGFSEQRLNAVMPQLRDQIAFFRCYPDIFVDLMKGPNCKF